MKSLSDQLEDAIFELVLFDRSKAYYQSSFGDWASQIRTKTGADFENAELVSAFRRLHNRSLIRLTKPDAMRVHASEYASGTADDENFFYRGPFNAVATDDGRSYWDHARFIDVKEAVASATTYFSNLMNISDVRLEEVELSDDERFWYVTLSGLIPTVKEVSDADVQTAFSALGNMFSPPVERVFKVFTVDAKTGAVRSMKIRKVA